MYQGRIRGHPPLVTTSIEEREAKMMQMKAKLTSVPNARRTCPATGSRSRVPTLLLCTFTLCALALASAPAAAQDTSLDRRLAKLKAREPLVEEVQDRAMRFFRVDPNRVNGMRTGAAWKALVPWFEVSGGATTAGINETTLLDEYQPVETELPWVKRSANGAALEGKARASWNLPNLLFNPEELDVSSLMMAQKDVINSVTQLYYERRRLQVQLMARAPRDPAERIQLEMRIEELTARLNGVTGGWFQQALDGGMTPE